MSSLVLLIVADRSETLLKIRTVLSRYYVGNDCEPSHDDHEQQIEPCVRRGRFAPEELTPTLGTDRIRTTELCSTHRAFVAVLFVDPDAYRRRIEPKEAFEGYRSFHTRFSPEDYLVVSRAVSNQDTR